MIMSFEFDDSLRAVLVLEYKRMKTCYTQTVDYALWDVTVDNLIYLCVLRFDGD